MAYGTLHAFLDEEYRTPENKHFVIEVSFEKIDWLFFSSEIITDGAYGRFIEIIDMVLRRTPVTSQYQKSLSPGQGAE
jgi:hypothetical protein